MEEAVLECFVRPQEWEVGVQECWLTYNTDNSAHSLNILGGMSLLDEASREEEGKEAQDAEAQGPASRSVLHYWKLWRSNVEGRKKTTPLLLL